MSFSLFGISYTLYELLLIFFTYAFLGWCSEVAFATLKTGGFVNRGFLNGPICPIYGFGMVIVVLCLTPLTRSWPLLFFGSMVLTTALEFFTGWVLETLFHTKWWDYTGRKFNIKGYVCLEFSILWGLACVLIMRVLHPDILSLLRRIPYKAGLVILTACILLGVIDLAATVSAIRGLQKRLKRLTALAEGMHDISDELGESISGAVRAVKTRTDEDKAVFDEISALVEKNRSEEKALAAAHRVEEQELLERLRGETKEVRAERIQARQAELRQKLVEVRSGEKRILRAFPALRVREDQDALDRLRNSIDEKKR